MNLPRLSAETRDAYLHRLGVQVDTPSLATLEALQQAHLVAVPFHNLALLDNDGAPYTIPGLEQIASDNARGVGGTCHLTTPAFASLLGTLGFDVHLVAGRVRHPGDHLLAMVHLPEGAFVVDVGNGHPYLHPLPLAHSRAWSVHGWRFSWRVDAPGPRLVRLLSDGQERTVYTVDPTPRTWVSFADAIRAHHEQGEFGPFLASLRAVRQLPERILVLRDGEYSRFAGQRHRVRPVTSRAAAHRLLVETMGLPPELVERALSALVRRRPAVFPATLDRPGVLVAVQSCGRVRQLGALLDSLEADRKASGLPTNKVEVVVLDNQAASRAVDLTPALASRPWPVTRVDVTQVDLSLERRLGLIPTDSPPLSIGAGRHALTRAVANRLDRLSGPWVVWLLDDDLQFTRSAVQGFQKGSAADRALLREATELWAQHPELSVLLGAYCGDPPIPGFATWWGQLRDLAATLQLLAGLSPDSRWAPPQQVRADSDDYYDHAGDRLPAHDAPPLVYQAGRGLLARELLDQLAGELAGLPWGRQVFRPVLPPRRHAPRPSRARGGHVVFLDPDALFAAPFPSFLAADGVQSRRADSLAALMLERQPACACAQADLTMLHTRQAGDGSSPMAAPAPPPAQLAQFVEAQARGIALARALENGGPDTVGEHLEHRRQLHRTGFEQTRKALEAARRALEEPTAWWHDGAEFMGAVAAIRTTLDAVEARIPDLNTLAEAESDVAAAMQEFLRALPERAADWRASWR